MSVPRLVPVKRQPFYGVVVHVGDKDDEEEDGDQNNREEDEEEEQTDENSDEDPQAKRGKEKKRRHRRRKRHRHEHKDRHIWHHLWYWRFAAGLAILAIGAVLLYSLLYYQSKSNDLDQLIARFPLITITDSQNIVLNHARQFVGARKNFLKKIF